MRLKEHGRDLRNLLGINGKRGTFMFSPAGLLKIRSTYPLVFQVGDDIIVRVVSEKKVIKVIKSDERFCDETVVLSFPADKPLSRTFLRRYPELLYALLVGMDEFGLSAYPESELLFNNERGGIECSPMVKSLGVADMLLKVSQKHGLRFSVKEPFPFSVHLEVR